MKYIVYLSCLLLLLSCSASEESTKSAAVEDIHANETARLNAWLDEEFAAYLDFSPLAKSERVSPAFRRVNSKST